jgi:hypothetical protein
VPSFIYFLAHKPIPEAPAEGLNLAYSRTVGVLHSLWREQYLTGIVGEEEKPVDFKAQQDRLLAAINRLTSGSAVEPRLNFDEIPEATSESRFIEPEQQPIEVAEEANQSQ